MPALFPDAFWLWLNRRCKPLPHPFNKAENGAMNLNYSPWEYAHASGKSGLHAFEIAVGDLLSFVDGKDIADLACGGGGKSVYLMSLGARSVKGCDFSANFIAQAQAFAREKGCADRCSFTVGDGEKTPYGDGEFDIVLVASVLEHTPDPRKMLEEALRIVKRDGVILFNTEGYYHWLGHHLWDVLPIPWLHLFTSERQRIRLYRRLTKRLPDGDARVAFRISTNAEGGEEIGYLNHLTLHRLERILQAFVREHRAVLSYYRINRFRRQPLRWLGHVPVVREMFHESVIGVLRRV